jgi:hypothetical protein
MYGAKVWLGHFTSCPICQSPLLSFLTLTYTAGIALLNEAGIIGVLI